MQFHLGCSKKTISFLLTKSFSKSLIFFNLIEPSINILFLYCLNKIFGLNLNILASKTLSRPFVLT